MSLSFEFYDFYFHPEDRLFQSIFLYTKKCFYDLDKGIKDNDTCIWIEDFWILDPSSFIPILHSRVLDSEFNNFHFLATTYGLWVSGFV